MQSHSFRIFWSLCMSEEQEELFGAMLFVALMIGWITLWVFAPFLLE